MKTILIMVILLLLSVSLLWAAIDYSAYADVLDCGFNSGDPGITEAFKSWGLAILASFVIYFMLSPFFFKKSQYWLASVVFVPVIGFTIMTVFLHPRFIEAYLVHARPKFCEIGLPEAIGAVCREPCSDLGGG